MNTSLSKLVLTLLLTGVVDIGLIDLPKATSQDKALGPKGKGTDLFPKELVDFVADPKEPVFIGAGPGHWDARIRERGWILREGDLYRMWYTGLERDSSPMLKLGYATSPDGIHWTRHDRNPLYDEHWVEDMMVVRHEGTYYMFAEGKGDQAHLLTSADGIKWKRVGQLDVRLKNGEPIEPGPYGTPTAWVENNVWYLFYERRDLGIWLATSKDMKVWTNVQDEPIIKLGPEDYDKEQVALNQIIKYNGRYYAYYHGAGSPLPGTRKRLWCTCVATSKDLIHWEKYDKNPLFPLEENKSSGILVHDGKRFLLYTMHDKVCRHVPREEPKGQSPVPAGAQLDAGKLLFFDEFEYEVKRDVVDDRPAFLTQGKWSGVKAINTGRKNAAGYLYTVDRIPGYKGKFPGRDSKRVLAIEARPGTFKTQTDFYLRLGDPRGPVDQIPGNVWFQFWIYLNYYDDPQDKEDQLSGITGGKWLYPSPDGNYPTHPRWLFTINHSSQVWPKGDEKPRYYEAKTYQEFQIHTLGLGPGKPPVPFANIKKAAEWDRWKMGQTNIDTRIVANRWTLVKLHFDTSTTSGRYEAWLQPLGSKMVKVAEYIDGVTPDFEWKIPREHVGGHKTVCMPTTLGDFVPERAKNNKDCWIYLDDFAMASSEEKLPKYSE